MTRRALFVRAMSALAALPALDAGRLAVAQAPVTWQLGRVQFQSGGYPSRGLRMDDQQADPRGGYVRITALNDGDCAPGAGVPPESIQQRFLFRWTFEREVSQLTFPQEFTVRFTIEADGNVPCLDLNPIMQVNVAQARLDSRLRGTRFYFRPDAVSPGFHEPGPRTVRVTTGEAWPNPVFFSLLIWGFRGNRLHQRPRRVDSEARNPAVRARDQHPGKGSGLRSKASDSVVAANGLTTARPAWREPRPRG